jgi:hypothetical protein
MRVLYRSSRRRRRSGSSARAREAQSATEAYGFKNGGASWKNAHA